MGTNGSQGAGGDGTNSIVGLNGDLGVFYDGYSRVACEVDIALETQRVYFKDHACGSVADCRLLHVPMEPRLCFDFCRQYKDAKFFGLRLGHECYCSGFFHAKSTGGQGACTAPCDGDSKEMCGGTEKSSLFEMHFCGDSADEASLALSLSLESGSAASSAEGAANATAQELRGLAFVWSDLGICSVQPEGPRVCGLAQVWSSAAAELAKVAGNAGSAARLLEGKTEEVRGLQAAVETAGESLNASLASGLELGTEAVQSLAGKAQGTAAAANLTLARVGGPIFGRSLDSFEAVFRPLGDVNASKHAVCGLEPIPGQAFAALAGDEPAKCADRCLSMSTGTQACVAFNYQFKDGLAACQLLTAEGLVEPMLAKAIPIFEVSAAKRQNMGLAALGCYAKEGWMAGHPKGPLGISVVREVTA